MENQNLHPSFPSQEMSYLQHTKEMTLVPLFRKANCYPYVDRTNENLQKLDTSHEHE